MAISSPLDAINHPASPSQFHSAHRSVPAYSGYNSSDTSPARVPDDPTIYYVGESAEAEPALPGIATVGYDITHKPPGTVEWE